jgi:hypothetical protein
MTIRTLLRKIKAWCAKHDFDFCENDWLDDKMRPKGKAALADNVHGENGRPINYKSYAIIGKGSTRLLALKRLWKQLEAHKA